MFDRPNEKLLFRTLHMLLLRLKPAIAQELRYCWPITTPQDKTTFKKLVQSVLTELEKQQQLPPGSSQASRINTGCGPRVVDLIWRLSSLAIRAALEREFAGKKFAPLPSVAHVSTADALLAVKTKIAMKTQALKARSVERCRVQDEWVEFAATLTARIHELSAAQQRVHEEQNAVDASTDRSAFSYASESRRATNLQNLETAWGVIDDSLRSPAYAKVQCVLRTAAQYDAEQPILAAADLHQRPDARGRSEPLDLSDVLASAEALVDSVRSRVRAGDFDKLNAGQAASVLDSSTRHVTTLRAMVVRLQQTVAQLKDANEGDARTRYIEMAARESWTPTRAAPLCPLTPAQTLHQESSRLVTSLEKVSMTELTALAAESVRRSHQRTERGLLPPEGAGAAASSDKDQVTRALDYDDDAMAS